MSETAIMHDQASNGPRSISQVLGPLEALVQTGQLAAGHLGPFQCQGRSYRLPRFIYRDRHSSDPIRIGMFAAIHGDEPAGTMALVQFLQDVVQQPELAQDYHLFLYPICNPTGFEDNTRHSRNGRDLNREFWKQSTEAEVQLLEQELKTHHFQGLIQLHADDTSDGIYGYVRGATLTENLLRPALLEAGKVLPRNLNALIDGFGARDGIIYDHFDGILAAPAQVEPVPFEIIFETPHLAEMPLQVKALVVAIKTILDEYRKLISFAQNL